MLFTCFTECTCNVNGSINNDKCAHKSNGDCECKLAIEGQRCEFCKSGYWGFGKDSLSGCKCKFDTLYGISNTNASAIAL